MSLESTIGGVPAPAESGLRALLTARFARYGAVGVIGIAVNLGALWVFTDRLGLHTNAAAALAIELSVLSNFVLNDSWTFADRQVGGRLSRILQYHLVTGVGAAIQWVVFVVANLGVFLVASDAVSVSTYAAGRDLLHAWILGPVVDPPDVGVLKYGSQLLGIGVAVVWNYLANLYWTWGPGAVVPSPQPAVALNTLPEPSSR